MTDTYFDVFKWNCFWHSLVSHVVFVRIIFRVITCYSCPFEFELKSVTHREVTHWNLTREKYNTISNTVHDPKVWHDTPKCYTSFGFLSRNGPKIGQELHFFFTFLYHFGVMYCISINLSILDNIIILRSQYINKINHIVSKNFGDPEPFLQKSGVQTRDLSKKLGHRKTFSVLP